MRCDHSGAHSGATRYVRQAGQLRLVLVCDVCGAEQIQLGSLDYHPDPSLPPVPAGAPASPGAPAAPGPVPQAA